MGNVKKLFQYLLPALLLPFLAGPVESLLFAAVAGQLNSLFLASDSVARTALSWLNTALYPLMLAGVALPAIQAEAGNVEKARRTHRTVFILFCAAVAGGCAAFLLLGADLLQLLVTPHEIIDIGVVELRAASITMLAIMALAILAGQALAKHSMIGVTAFCLALMAMGTVGGFVALLQYGMGAAAMGLMRGFVAAASRVAPFLLIPLRTYADQFAPAQPEEAEEA